MITNFDLDGDGRLDPIEAATARTYYESLRGEDGELFFDDRDEFTFGEEDDVIFDPNEEW